MLVEAIFIMASPTQCGLTISENHVTVGHGVRCVLTERPDDERLGEPDFLENHKKVFGEQWFWQNPTTCGVKIPCFDRSEITRHT